MKNVAQTLTAINNVNKEISVDEIYEINKLIFINTVQDDLIEIQANNQAQYVLSDTEIQSLKNNDWNKVNNDWLYVENGHAVTGWFKEVDGNWYYLKPNGSMATNTNINGYYINQYGIWL
ncbi:hypothetical protein [uncultured Clostridium sp.]|uniref:hypothetical protein n=1 Tax=uncultured Clostridium sp. TaxID=59620 RepID=UPI0028E6B506|nr:hypothetical protein [uncultured Clostridium sp.]